MIINIHSKKTINEYKHLQASQQEIKINQTSKKLDEYVYDKTHKFNNSKILGGMALVNLFYTAFAYKSKQKLDLTQDGFILCAANLAFLATLRNNYLNKKDELTNPQKKLELYKKNGINAVI